MKDIKEEIKDITHSRGENWRKDIRGACGNPCYQCDKDKEIFKIIDRIYAQAWEDTLSEAVESVKEVRRQMKIEHTCRFNDCEQDCDCYVEAITKVLSELLKLKPLL